MAQQIQPQQENTQHEGSPLEEAVPQHSAMGRPGEGVTLAVQRMWEVVRKGADVIVTLRQENAQLQMQMAQVRRSEAELQERVDNFVERIAKLEEKNMMPGITDTRHGIPIDRLEDKIAALEAELADAHARLTEHNDLSQQLMQVRLELEARTQLFQELQDNYDDRPSAPSAVEEERDRLQAELDKTLAIIERYRAAGLRHVEDPASQDQLALFVPSEGGVSMSAADIRFLAARLESVAIQLDELAKLS